MQILLEYPSLLPKNAELTEFYGYLNIHATDYEIHLLLENGKPTLKMNEELSKFQNDIIRLTNTCTDPLHFLNSLTEIISSKTACSVKRNLSDSYRHILTEYTEFREFYINLNSCMISEDLSAITLTTLDEYGRTHKLSIKVNYDTGNVTFNISRHDLPDKEDFTTPNTSLSVLYETFLKAIEELQPYLNLMDQFDSNCWILDPETPKPKDCYRRIAFDNNISMVITINPWKCNGIPSLQFLGSERLVSNFRSKVSNNLENWDFKADTFGEVLKLLEMSSFPSKPQMDHREEVLYNTGECCICFSLRLNEKLPEVICSNPSCEQFFHIECLYQWLVSIAAKTKQTFNELHGDCPNCEKHISCPLP